jgi:hypothetical protein
MLANRAQVLTGDLGIHHRDGYEPKNLVGETVRSRR